MGRPDSIVPTVRGLLPLQCWDVRSVGRTPTDTSGRPTINQADLNQYKGFPKRHISLGCAGHAGRGKRRALHRGAKLSRIGRPASVRGMRIDVQRRPDLLSAAPSSDGIAGCLHLSVSAGGPTRWAIAYGTFWTQPLIGGESLGTGITLVIVLPQPNGGAARRTGTGPRQIHG